jgi:hypothetical protein
MTFFYSLNLNIVDPDSSFVAVHSRFDGYAFDFLWHGQRTSHVCHSLSPHGRLVVA